MHDIVSTEKLPLFYLTVHILFFLPEYKIRSVTTVITVMLLV